MSKPQEQSAAQVTSIPYPMPQNVPLQNTVPLQYHVNIHPGQQNVYPSPPMWTVSSGAPQMVYAATQPAPPGFQVPAGVFPQAPGPASQNQQIFLKGKPKSLGIVLIVTAILQLVFGIALACLIAVSVTVFSGIAYWGPLFYIIAGSLSVSAQKKLDLCLIKSSLAFNILSSIFSMTGIIINIADFSVMDEYKHGGHHYDDDDDGGAENTIVAFILVINLLVFCVTVSLCVFGCRAIENVPSNNTPTVLVMQNGYVQPPTAFPGNSPIPQAPPPSYVFQSEEKQGLQ